MALRDGRSAGRMFGGGSLDGTQRRLARQVPDQLSRNTRHNLGSRKFGLRIGSPAPVVTSFSPSYASVLGGDTITLTGDYFDVNTPNYISPQGTMNVPTNVVVINEQTLTFTLGASPAYFGQIDVYVYNSSLTLAGNASRCFRYQPFEQVGAGLFYRANLYSVTSGVGTWQSSERGGPLINYFPVSAATSPPINNAGSPQFTTSTTPLENSDVVDNWYSVNNHHVIAVVDLDAITTSFPAAYDNAPIFTDTSGNYGLHVRRAGSAGSYTYWADVYEYYVGAKTATVEITSFLDANGAGRVVLQGKKEGGFLHARAGSGAWVTGDAVGTGIGGNVGTLRIGATYDLATKLQGTIRALGLYPFAKDDATFSDLIPNWAALNFPVAKVKILDLDSRFVTLNISDPTLVDSWQDQSGNGFDATAPSGAQATYQASRADYNNLPAVRFPYNSINYYDTSSSIAASIGTDPVTMFLVGHVDNLSQTGNGYFLMTQGGQPVGMFSQGLQFWSPYAGSKAPYAEYTITGVKSALATVFTGGDTSRFYQNSTIPKTYSSYQGETTKNIQLERANVTTGLRIGQWQAPSTVYSPSGPILRVVIYKGALNQLQIEEVLAEFETTYNILVENENTLGIVGKWIAGSYSDVSLDPSAVTVGRWSGADSRGTSLGQDWISPTGALIPTLSSINTLSNPQTDGANDYMEMSPTTYPYKSRKSIDSIFASNGGGGTIIAGIIAHDAPVYNPGTVTAQTPYENDGIVTDSSGYMGLHWSDGGFTAGLYDATARDSGGGPASNNGWQMATVPATVSVPNIAIMRWNGTVLELGVNAIAGVTTWTTVDAGVIAYRLGTLRLGTNYNAARYLNADIGAIQLYNRALTDAEVNAAGYEIQTALNWSQGFTSVGGTSAIAAQVDGISTTTASINGDISATSTINSISTTSTTIQGAVPATSTITSASTVTAVLRGSGVIAATTTNTSTISAAINGTISAACTIASTNTSSATITGSILGASTISGVSATTATIIGTGTIGSIIVGVDTVSGALLGAGAIASTTANASTTRATLQLFANVASTSTITASVLAVASATSTIIGTSTTNANLTGIIPVSSTVSGIDTVTASLLAAGAIATTSIGASIISASLVASGNISGTIAGTSTTSATLSIISRVDSVSTTTANATGTGTIASSIASFSTITANISGNIPAASTVVGTSTVSASIIGLAPVFSTVAGTSTVTAVITSSVFANSTISGTSTITANLLASGSLASTVAGTSAVIATPNLYATSTGVSTVSATLLGSAPLASTITSTSTVIATADLLSRSNGSSTTTAALLGSGRLLATVAGTSTIIATTDLLSISTGSSTVSASLLATGNVAATSNGLSTSIANLIAAGVLTTSIAGSSTIAASISGSAPLSSTISGTSTITANATLTGVLQSTINSTSTTNASTLGSGALVATVNGTSTCTLTSVEGEIRSTSNNTSSVTANITGLVFGNSTIANISTITASLLGVGSFSSTVAGLDSVSASSSATGSLTANVSSTSAITANGSATTFISATVTNTSATVASLVALVPASATVVGSSTVSATLPATGNASSAVNSNSTITANALGNGRLAGTISNTASLTAQINGNVQGSTTLTGSSTVTATPTISSQIAGNSTVKVTPSISARVNGTSTVSATTLTQTHIDATVNSNSSCTATISARAGISSTIPGTAGHSLFLNGAGFLQALILSTSNVYLSIPSLVEALVNGTSSTIADCQNASFIYAEVAGNSTVTGTLFEYLADKSTDYIQLVDGSDPIAEIIPAPLLVKVSPPLPPPPPPLPVPLPENEPITRSDIIHPILVASELLEKLIVFETPELPVVVVPLIEDTPLSVTGVIETITEIGVIEKFVALPPTVIVPEPIIDPEDQPIGKSVIAFASQNLGTIHKIVISPVVVELPPAPPLPPEDIPLSKSNI